MRLLTILEKKRLFCSLGEKLPRVACDERVTSATLMNQSEHGDCKIVISNGCVTFVKQILNNQILTQPVTVK